ncbi:hypothetical protein Airi02_089580 [Actinoallomurus iriomotensis]|uniref:Uncharacterized protein n=1 Tax=Actinoallomurus iriomotensis TaxID=478107 RepID=A0A9W6W514_9ACTN|nr:hypothetical protein Airi02_089580 [Actinoallomurus iriomotensis]
MGLLRQVTGDGLEVTIRFRGVHCAESFVEFFQVKAAFPGCFAENRGDVVPIGVRDAHLAPLRKIHHADRLKRRIARA